MGRIEMTVHMNGHSCLGRGEHRMGEGMKWGLSRVMLLRGCMRA